MGALAIMANAPIRFYSRIGRLQSASGLRNYVKAQAHFRAADLLLKFALFRHNGDDCFTTSGLSEIVTDFYPK